MKEWSVFGEIGMFKHYTACSFIKMHVKWFAANSSYSGGDQEDLGSRPPQGKNVSETLPLNKHPGHGGVHMCT
jgi:hypothetical protein